LGTYAFDNTNNCPIYVPWGTESVYKTDWSAYESRIVAPATFKARLTNKNSSTIDIPLNGSTTLSSSETKAYSATVASVVITTAVTSIGKSAFYYYSGMTSVEIPSSVTSIGASAFLHCTSLSSVTIPSGVTSIGDWTFQTCSGLTSVNIPNTVTSIGEYAFDGCRSLSSITIPESVSRIGASGFTKCYNLSSITCNRTTAPTLGSNVFKNAPSTGTLYYPNGSNYTTWKNALPSGWTLTPI
jgi:hypothetical protein